MSDTVFGFSVPTPLVYTVPNNGLVNSSVISSHVLVVCVLVLCRADVAGRVVSRSVRAAARWGSVLEEVQTRARRTPAEVRQPDNLLASERNSTLKYVVNKYVIFCNITITYTPIS